MPGLSDQEIVEILASRPAARTAMTGAAGEYFVAAELSLRGWLATVTIKNSPGTDILARKPTTGTMVAIQTKTASYGNNFQLNKKDETPTAARNEWYVLVKLHEEKTRPTFYVVPRNIVAGVAFAQHLEWLSRSRRDGKPHKDTAKRVLLPAEFSGYEDRWDLLSDLADEAPLLIGAWYAQCVSEFGLPSGHPGWPSS